MPGVFGNAFRSPGGRYGKTGSFDALGNILPERGTIAFHVKQDGMVYGFEPLLIQTAYHSYYWGMYIRISNKNNRLSVWFPDEVYRPIVLSAPADITLVEGQWHHLAVAWDQALGARFYVDGKEVASNWGKASWTSRGVDANMIELHQSKGVAYDELYVFDRPLGAEQIARLAKDNVPPGQADLTAVPFGEAQRANRRRELSWNAPDVNIPPSVQLGPVGLGGNAFRQVIPIQARSVKRDCNEVFDGKLGSGWPPLYNYSFNHGNGLHVELGEAWDYATIEGHFNGVVYDQHCLTQPDGLEPYTAIESSSFMHRIKADPSQKPGHLSFFKTVMEDKGELPDKELVTVSRVCELSFFRVGEHDLGDTRARRYYIGPADLALGPTALGTAFTGQFAPGDRAALALATTPAQTRAGQEIPALRFHHLITPAAAADIALKGIRLVLWLQDARPGTTLRVEMRDALLPLRRTLALDVRLDGATSNEPQCVDLTIDLSDRIIPRDGHCWLTFCFSTDTVLLWDGPERASYVELLTGPRDEVAPEFFRTELAFVKTRFRELSEARPWTHIPDPEATLADINRYARELFYPLMFLRRLEPEHEQVKAIWAWTHKQIEDTSPVTPKPVSACSSAPRWALLQRELLQGCRDVLYWWIDHRQVPSGEFGDAWGDDTDLTQNFAKLVLLGDPDGRLRKAVRLVADGVYEAGLIERGINARTMDTLHAYEEGVNVQPVMALMDYGNPKYVERLMEAAKTVDEHLTARDVKGRRRFRSWNFSASEVKDKGEYGWDHPGNALFCHPAAFLTYYGRHPRALSFLQEWIDGWLDIYAENAPKDERRVPNRTLMDGRVIGWDAKIRGYGYVDLYAALHTVTGEPRYAQILPWWTAENGNGRFMRGSHYLPALEMLDRQRFRKELVAWAEEADLLHPHQDRVGGAARERYMKFEVSGDETAAYEALEVCLRNLRILFDAYTWGEPIDDRIWLPDHPLIMMMQGEISHERNQIWPRHYLSYDGYTDVAAWVREKSDTELHVWLYSFASKAEDGVVRTWRTPLGTYRVSFGPDADGDVRPDDDSNTSPLTLHHSAEIPLVLPPRALCALSIKLQERSTENFWTRPDLGIGAGDAAWQEDKSLRVTVHNLGNSAAANCLVRVVSTSGKTCADQRIAKLDAPLDLVPRTQTVTFADLPDGDLTVVLDPDGQIPELNEANNTVPLRRANARP